MIVVIVLARNENRAQLEEDANSLGSGPFVSRIGRPRGSVQTQGFEKLRGDFLAFGEERNFEEQTQVFHSPGDGGTREGCVDLRILQRWSRGNGAEVGGREVLRVQRFCVESQIFPILFGYSGLRAGVTKYEIPSVFLVDRLRIRKHPQFSFKSVRGT